MVFFIGIDVGTSNTKAILFDQEGNEVVSSQRYYSFSQPQPGYAEQDPEIWWQSVSECLHELMQKSQISSESVLGLGVTGQMHGLVMLDKEDKVLCDSILWCDQRTIAEAAMLDRLVGKETLLSVTGNPALTGFTAAKILWVKTHKPELWERCQKIMLPKDYINYKLTNIHTTDVSDASGTQLLDLTTRDWSEPILNQLAIPKKRLGKVFESGDVVGPMTKEASQITGLSPKTIVIAGAGDQAAAAIGNGIVKPGLISLNLGSSGVLFATTKTPVYDPQGRIHTLCHAVKDTWHVMAVTQGAGLSLKWFAEQFYHPDTNPAVDINKLIDNEVEKTPLGASGLVFLPYLMGERSPHLDPYARGVFFGIAPIHTRGHFSRAIMEGVALSFKDCLSVMTGIGIHSDEIRMSGGGANSSIWTTIIANCLKRPIRIMKEKEAGVRGMAILAMAASGTEPSIEDAIKRFVHPGSSVVGEADDMEQYEKYYRLYQSIYRSLKETFVLAHES